MTDLNLEKHINREISTCYANLRNFKIVFKIQLLHSLILSYLDYLLLQCLVLLHTGMFIAQVDKSFVCCREIYFWTLWFCFAFISEKPLFFTS